MTKLEKQIKMRQDVLFILNANRPYRMRRSEIANRPWMADEYQRLSMEKRCEAVRLALLELREVGMVETQHTRWFLTSTGKLEADGDGTALSPEAPFVPRDKP